MPKYKVRFYYIRGRNQGNVLRDEFYHTFADAYSRFEEATCRKKPQNWPTVWIWKEADWRRLSVADLNRMYIEGEAQKKDGTAATVTV